MRAGMRPDNFKLLDPRNRLRALEVARNFRRWAAQIILKLCGGVAT